MHNYLKCAFFIDDVGAIDILSDICHEGYRGINKYDRTKVVRNVVNIFFIIFVFSLNLQTIESRGVEDAVNKSVKLSHYFLIKQKKCLCLNRFQF